ncbi:MAG TPA: ATP-binding cassette domain-containing protein [Burkholderiales bacterium]|nr:ATP-binding cassette domain-containing protein [Burkholderiales bacterium]
MTASSSDITVSAQGLSRSFGARRAVDAVSLELRRGEILGLLGPNGAGKTTTMQMLTGNLAPSGGGVSICGIDLLEQPTAAKAHLGYLPEHPPLYRELTVREYLDLAARLHRVARPRRGTAVAEAIERCGLAEVTSRLIGALSKGYQQRVGIAQAIVHSPDVVILDEPTVGLDPNQIRDIRGLIRELGDSHSVILSTHILPEVESVCDRVQIMHHGSTVFSDTITGLRQFHAGRRVLLGLRRPPQLSALATIPGVARAEEVSANLFRINFANGGDPTDTLVRRAVDDDWGLTQLTPAQTSLEDVFTHLTQTEDA